MRASAVRARQTGVRRSSTRTSAPPSTHCPHRPALTVVVAAASTDAPPSGSTPALIGALLNKVVAAAPSAGPADVVLVADGQALSAGLALGLLRAGLRVTLGAF